MRRAPLVVALAFAASACGKGSGPAAPKGPDFSSPEIVWTQASKALETGDLAGLSVYLSDAGSKQVTRDLKAWALVLKDPAEGPRTLARIPAARTSEETADVGRALSGDTGSLLRLYVRADPHPAGAPPVEPVPPRAKDAAF